MPLHADGAGSTFLRISTGATIVIALAYVFAAVTIATQGDAHKPLGWTASVAGQGGWIVATVAPDGPAAGLLNPGDAIRAIDGDTTARRIGPAWTLRDTPEKADYVLGISRQGEALDVRVPWPLEEQPWLAFWRAMYLTIGLVYLITGLMIAFARPESDVARRAVLSAVLTSVFFVGNALASSAGMLSGAAVAVVAAAWLVRPFHVLAGYRFTAAFPSGGRSTGAWRAFDAALWVVSVAMWVPTAGAAALRMLGPERAPAIVARYVPWLSDSANDAALLVFAGILAIANALVVWRNYRQLADPDLRRRTRWVSIGVAAGMVPILVVTPFIVTGYAAGERETFTAVIRFVNLVTVAIPLCIAYAVIRHRVLGVRMALRIGLQYLLAKNVLRVALAAPVVAIAWSLATTPGATLLDVGSGSGRWRLVLVMLAAIALWYRRPFLAAIDRRFFREAYRQDRIFSELADAIGQASGVKDISRLLSSQIRDALHPKRIVALARESREEFSPLYSSSAEREGQALAFGDLRLSPHAFEDVGAAAAATTAPVGTAERDALSSLDIHLVVPIRGPNEGMQGLLLLGGKQSEEPYTANDRRMLDTIAAQAGVVWENVKLRERLGREQAVRRELLSRTAEGSAEMLLECPECGACYDGTASKCATDGRDLTPSLPIPKTLAGKYDIRRVIGRGGMGAVYEALDLRLERTVAVKVASGALFGDAVALQRFAREARASARLDHPNVVRAFDYGDVPGGAYLVLERLRGETLKALLRRQGTIAPRETARILRGVFDGVAAVHDLGIVHRDLKPENVFLVPATGDAGASGERSDGPVPKILDFGLAAMRDLGFADANKLTRTGTAVGTLAYMSAEQFLGDTVDERADVYALGVLALEMLTGDLEARGALFGRIGALVAERLEGPAYGPAAARRQVTQVLSRALAERAEDRYRTVRLFAAELLPALGSWADEGVGAAARSQVT